MISKRKLEKIRRVALLKKGLAYTNHTQTLIGYILELTQELLDQNLQKPRTEKKEVNREGKS